MFDVVVVGGRCAGAPLGMLLARLGHRVLVIDGASFPSDTLSTHFIWPRGISYLAEWGLLDEATARTPCLGAMELRVEDVTFRGTVPAEWTKKRFEALHGRAPAHVEERYASVRRTVLDHALIRAADAAGAEIRTECRVTELLRDGDRVVGVRGRTKNGQAFEERAKLVVAADGRRSTLTKLLGLRRVDVHPQCTFAYWSYFEGIAVGEAHLCKRGRLGAAVVPTTDDAHVVLAFGPKDWWTDFRRDAEGNHAACLAEVAPDLAEKFQGARRTEKFFGIVEQAAYSHRMAGPGWLAIGDAACVKDQCTASGITHAFRDAALAADHVHRALSGECTLDEAGEAFRRAHYTDSVDYFRFVCMQAEMQPTRPEELEVFRATAADPNETGRLLAAYGDSLPVRHVASRRHLSKMLWQIPAVDEAQYREASDRSALAHVSPFADGAAQADAVLLHRSTADFARPTARNLLDRAEAYDAYVGERLDHEIWPYARYFEKSPTVDAEQRDGAGRVQRGVNYASQDYLSLCSHPKVREAAKRALDVWGPHSAGSPMGVGNTAESRALEDELANFLHKESVLLFPTGWAAGFGAICGLTRPGDVIVLDEYAHNCLLLGARASGAAMERYRHCDSDALGWTLERIRRRAPGAGVLVVTEGTFSMDADSPDLRAASRFCKQYDATLLVDVAHDLGATGPTGLGQLELQDVLGEVDYVMGSFSKTFASNGGFVASRRSVTRYIQQFAGSHTFSNGLAPSQVATVRAALEIVRSEEGRTLRERAAASSLTLRRMLEERGLSLLGAPGPIVPVWLGEEALARRVYRAALDRGVITNMIEHPIVPSGQARLRLQVMAEHDETHAEQAAEGLRRAVEDATTPRKRDQRAAAQSPAQAAN